MDGWMDWYSILRVEDVCMFVAVELVPVLSN